MGKPLPFAEPGGALVDPPSTSAMTQVSNADQNDVPEDAISNLSDEFIDTSSSESSSEEDAYHFRVCFRNLTTWGCVWPANNKAILRYGCAVINHYDLEISDELKALITCLVERFTHRASWSKKEWTSFHDESCTLVPYLQEELGPKYVVFDGRDQNS